MDAGFGVERVGMKGGLVGTPRPGKEAQSRCGCVFVPKAFRESVAANSGDGSLKPPPALKAGAIAISNRPAAGQSMRALASRSQAGGSWDSTVDGRFRTASIARMRIVQEPRAGRENG